MKIRLYDRHFTARKALIHWMSGFLAFGPVSILLHFFTVEYDLFQGVFIATFTVAVEYLAFYSGRRSRKKKEDHQAL